MICQGIDPEHEIIGSAGENAAGRHEHPIEIVPAKPCDQTATMLARSMTQVECNVGSLHWVKTEDKVYCGGHYLPGTMTHMDGLVTIQPVIRIEDA